MKTMSHTYNNPHLFFSIVTAFLGFCLFVVADSQSLLFATMEGGTGFDRAYDATTDAVNNIYLTGLSHGPTDSKSFSARGIFLAKYTPEGERIYMKSFGSLGDVGYSVVTDSNLNLYLGGQVCESFQGQPHLGFCDALLMKLDVKGTELYVKEFGTELDDAVTSLAVDGSDNLFAGGYYKRYSQAFIRKYTSAGDLLFEKVIDRMSVRNYIVWKLTNLVLDSEGSVYVTTQDAYVTKFNSTGELQFTRMIEANSTNVYGRGLARDSADNVYVVSNGLDNRNSTLTKFSKDGTRLLAIKESGVGLAVAVDKQDNVYTSSDKSDYLGMPSKTLLYVYSPQGERVWSTVLLNNISPVVSSLHVDAGNNLLLSGWAYGNINNVIDRSSYDAFVMKYNPLNSSIPTTQHKQKHNNFQHYRRSKVSGGRQVV